MDASVDVEMVTADGPGLVLPSPPEINNSLNEVSTDEIVMSDFNDRDRDPKNRFAVVFGYVGARFQGLQRFGSSHSSSSFFSSYIFCFFTEILAL